MMKRIAITLLSLAIFGSAYAKTFDITYDGSLIDYIFPLTTGDVVMIHTAVNIGSAVLISVDALESSSNNYTFATSLAGRSPNRATPFADYVVVATNPGWVSYTYNGEKVVDAEFRVRPT